MPLRTLKNCTASLGKESTNTESTNTASASQRNPQTHPQWTCTRLFIGSIVYGSLGIHHYGNGCTPWNIMLQLGPISQYTSKNILSSYINAK